MSPRRQNLPLVKRCWFQPILCRSWRPPTGIPECQGWKDPHAWFCIPFLTEGHRGPEGGDMPSQNSQQCSRVFPSCKLPLGSILFTEHSFLPRARSVSSGRQNKALDGEAQTTETYSLTAHRPEVRDQGVSGAWFLLRPFSLWLVDGHLLTPLVSLSF